jgi:TPR repeat protein
MVKLNGNYWAAAPRFECYSIGLENNSNTSTTPNNSHGEADFFKKAKIAAEAGDAEYQYQVGMMYKNGVGIDKNPQAAKEWLQKSAAQGNTAAENQLNTELFNDTKLLAAQGSKAAENQLDIEKFNKTKLSAEAGDPIAQNKLGLLYKHGTGVELDNQKAIEWIQKSADQKYAFGERNLACMLYGKNNEQDRAKAKDLLQDAANQGEKESARILKAWFPNL